MMTKEEILDMMEQAGIKMDECMKEEIIDKAKYLVNESIKKKFTKDLEYGSLIYSNDNNIYAKKINKEQGIIVETAQVSYYNTIPELLVGMEIIAPLKEWIIIREEYND